MILLSTPCFFSFRTPPSFLAIAIAAAAAANEAQKAAAKQRRLHRGARAVLASVLLCAFRLLLERFSNNGPSQFSLQWPFLGSELALLCRSLCYVAALMQRWDSMARRLRACVVLLFCFMAKQLSSSKYPCGFEQLFPVINCD